MIQKRTTIAIALVALSSGLAVAGGYTGFENLSEGFAGASFSDGGITFFGMNNDSGLNPDGSTYEPGEYGTDFIIENATLAINDFPGTLSGTNVLSWGTSFIGGDNLSINILSTFSMTTGQLETAASLNLLYFENGPWGGITIEMLAMRDGMLVNSDSILISDLGGRDNLIGDQLSVSGIAFDTLTINARFDDGTSTVFAGLIDNVTITPAPGTAGLLLMAGAGVMRRRRNG
ncbi:MAG: MYXO-CTERM sorting domain-containing protein [Phycisphaerales bacterium]